MATTDDVYQEDEMPILAPVEVIDAFDGVRTWWIGVTTTAIIDRRIGTQVWWWS